MNVAKRRKLEKSKELLEKFKTIIAEVREDEGNSFENFPENFQVSERGEAMQTVITSLEEVEECVDTIEEHIDISIKC